MPTLLELQRAMRLGLIERDPTAITASLADGFGRDRLDIYRNTIFSGLTKTLRLAYPAVERLVGAEFFDGAAEVFATEHLPRAAYLDWYGTEFPDFLRRFPPAASLAYLADVATLEWAVNCALHAPDLDPLELPALAAIPPEEQIRVSFRAHPSVSLLCANYPVDQIWRTVLASDDRALAALDLVAEPVRLLVERGAAGVEVARLEEPAWRFLAALCSGETLFSAVGSAADFDAATAFAGHLAAGRFVAFTLSAQKAGESRAAPA